jgi:hypothetical protein
MPHISTRHSLKELWSLFDQLFGAPLSTQQMIEFFCAVVSVPVFGIVPLPTEVLIATLALNI